MEGLRLAIQTRLGERMVSMSSTLVETVSINYEDFNESFLTCGTCLCLYDGGEHTPKLLPCSHTVCLHCLARIAASSARDAAFRCPICRELINVPRGGVAALPPSFLVNQLLDLMSRQRREVVPKCSVHINQELLFCETCDAVFCALCTGGAHSAAGAAEHTVIPFSIAIKRMSEILLYKANECIAKLSGAREAVSGELQRLDRAADGCLEAVGRQFAEAAQRLEARRLELSAAVGAARDEKRRVLEEQLALIDAEKNKVERECEGLQYQVEVRNITQRIAGLGDKLEAAGQLSEPRENAFLTVDFADDAPARLADALAAMGRVRSSTSFPALCTVRLEGAAVARLEARFTLSTVDYHGSPRSSGGDPVTAEALAAPPGPGPGSGPDAPSPAQPPLPPCDVVDNDDGSYTVSFRPPAPGRYALKVCVLDRPVRDCPLFFEASEHNNPVATYGQRGGGKDEFLQPVAVAVDAATGFVYVVDTGNSRIKVLSPELQFVRHVENEGLAGRSCTGIATSVAGLVVVNWRSRTVTEMTTEGHTVRSFTHANLQEPIDVAVDASYGHVLVADNGRSAVFVFDADGKLLFQVGKKGSQKGCFNLISSVTVGPNGEIVVADSRIQVFSAKGDFMEELYAEGKGRGRYGGVAVDAGGRVVATRCEKSRAFVHVLQMQPGSTPTGSGPSGPSGSTSAVLAYIDSHDARLKRPSGVAVAPGGFALVVDLGNDCLKKYRYW